MGKLKEDYYKMRDLILQSLEENDISFSLFK